MSRNGTPLQRAAEMATASRKRGRMTQRICAVCGEGFLARRDQIQRGTGRYCSKRCSARSRSTPERDIARFWAKVDRRGDDECWPWLGPIRSDGYCQFLLHGKKAMAHRVAYELTNGPIDIGLQVDHVRARGCTLRWCMNPSHLEPVTQRENIMRGDAPPSINAKKTTCSQGHALQGDNLIEVLADNGRTHRKCRTCRIASQRAYIQRKKEAA